MWRERCWIGLDHILLLMVRTRGWPVISFFSVDDLSSPSASLHLYPCPSLYPFPHSIFFCIRYSPSLTREHFLPHSPSRSNSLAYSFAFSVTYSLLQLPHSR